jgi:hypothetical protein
MLGKLIKVTDKVKAKQAQDILLQKSMELEKARGAVAADFSGVGAPVVSRAGAATAPKVTQLPKPKMAAPAPEAPHTPEATAAKVKTMWEQHFPEEPGKGEAFSRQLLEHMTGGRHEDALRMVSELTSHMAHRTAHKAAMDHINAGRLDQAKQVLEAHRSQYGQPQTPVGQPSTEPIASTATDKHPAAAPGVTDPNPSVPPPPPSPVAAQPSKLGQAVQWLKGKFSAPTPSATPAAVTTVAPAPKATFTEQAPKPSFAPQSPTLARPTTMSPDLVAKLSSWQAQRKATPEAAPAPVAAPQPQTPVGPVSAPAQPRRVVVNKKQPQPAPAASSQQLEQQVRQEGAAHPFTLADLADIGGGGDSSQPVNVAAKKRGRPRRAEPAVDEAQAKVNQEQGAEQDANREAKVSALRSQQQARKWKPEYGMPKAKWEQMTSAQIDEFLANRAKPQ